MILLTLSFVISILFLFLFFFASKSTIWNILSSSSFECGFTSYFFSRYSFSMHYFLVGLIFLFLDLELCLLMPFFTSEFPSFLTFLEAGMFILILIVGLLYEWKKEKLDWKF